MFKNPFCKNKKIQPKFSTSVNYQLDVKPIEINTSLNIAENTPISINKNQIKKLSDDFYMQMHSITNLTKPYLFLQFIVVPIMFFLSTYILFSIEAHKDSFPIFSMFLFFLATSIFVECRNKNEKIILLKQSELFKKDFLSLEEARVYWIKDKIGFQTDFFEYAEKLAKWKKYKKEYHQGYKTSWILYIYDPQSKPRILALFLALVSLCALIVINTVEVDPLDFLLSIGIIKFIWVDHIIATTIALSFCFLIFWQTLTMGHVFIRFMIYIFDYFNKNGISELRFSILLNFLLDHSEFTKN